MMRRLLWVVVLVGSLLPLDGAWACSCARRSLATLYESSPHVFTALITGGEVRASPERRGEQVLMQFRLLDSFKGDPPFETLTTGGSGGLCGRSLQIGIAYLVFAPDSGRIGTCSGILALTGDNSAPGRTAVAVLEAHRRGDHPLVDPWYDAHFEDRCLLRTHIDLPAYGHPATLALEHGPAARDDPTPRTVLWFGLAHRGEDQATYPMSLKVGASEWLAVWVGRTRGRPARYELVGEPALALVEALQSPAVTSMRLAFGHPMHGQIEHDLWTAHARNAMRGFTACVAAAQRTP